MKREIKFRAWDKKFNVMLDEVGVYDNNNIIVVDVHVNDKYGDSLDERLEIIEDAGPEHYCITGNIEIMQLTGLSDKNGTEIYEGDIIESIQTKYKYVVKWDNENMRFLASTKSFIADTYKFGEYYTVIGNIFQSPEIL